MTTFDLDNEIKDFLGLVSKNIYTRFIKTTNDNSMTAEEFISWCKQ